MCIGRHWRLFVVAGAVGLALITFNAKPLEPHTGTFPARDTAEKNNIVPASPFFVTRFDIAIGIISKRREYYNSLQKSLLQYVPQGVVLRSKGNCPCNLRAGFSALVHAFPSAKWYYVGKDDSFIFLDRLLGFLSDLNYNLPIIVARNIDYDVHTHCGMVSPMIGNEKMFYGGTGHIISGSMARALDWNHACENAGFYGEDLDSFDHPKARYYGEDFDSTCFFSRHWESHFRFVPFSEDQAVLHVDENKERLNSSSIIVGQHLSPQDLEKLANINNQTHLGPCFGAQMPTCRRIAEPHRVILLSVASNDGC